MHTALSKVHRTSILPRVLQMMFKYPFLRVVHLFFSLVSYNMFKDIAVHHNCFSLSLNHSGSAPYCVTGPVAVTLVSWSNCFPSLNCSEKCSVVAFIDPCFLLSFFFYSMKIVRTILPVTCLLISMVTLNCQGQIAYG